VLTGMRSDEETRKRGGMSSLSQSESWSPFRIFPRRAASRGTPPPRPPPGGQEAHKGGVKGDPGLVEPRDVRGQVCQVHRALPAGGQHPVVAHQDEVHVFFHAPALIAPQEKTRGQRIPDGTHPQPAVAVVHVSEVGPHDGMALTVCGKAYSSAVY